MNTPSVRPQVVLTIQVSEVLYSTLQVTAAMSQTTIGAVIQSALREKAVGTPEKPPFRPIPAPQPIRQTSAEPVIGSLQQTILSHLVDAPAGVYDLRDVRRTLAGSHPKNSVSRAIAKLVRSGLLEPVSWNGNGFIPADRREQPQLRFVRRR